MDDRLEKALEFANYRMTVDVQKKNLAARVETLQTVHITGGSFKADSATIAFVKTMLDLGNETLILTDLKGNPVEIQDTQEFLDSLTSAYNNAMSEHLVESQKIKKARNIKTIMDW